jgi:predicted transposase/invertase (TIGR01784 family)
MTITPNRLISFLTDYGFKITFANEKNKIFLKKAIQLLVKTPLDIKSIQHQPTEFEGIAPDARKGFYDTLCLINKELYFIIEMQVGNYKDLKERILFYIAQLYIAQILKGKSGFKSIKKVHCICITKDTIFKDVPEYYNKVNFRNETGILFFDNMEIILVELEKFTKLAPEIDNELEELLFTMKNAHTVDLLDPLQIPNFWRKEWFQEAIKELNLSTMSPMNRALYNISVARLISINDHFNDEVKAATRKAKRQMKKEVREEVKEEVREEVKEEVREEVKEEVREEVTQVIMYKTIQRLLSAGKFSVQDIADSQDVDVSFVLKIKDTLDINKPHS